LSEINISFIKSINEVLNINTEILDSRQLELTGNKSERLVEAVKKVDGDVYLSGPSAKSYLNKDLFLQEGIKIEWKSYESYPEYPSFHDSIKHGVSVLDLIFNNTDLTKSLISST
jgi:hypothetical protein